MTPSSRTATRSSPDDVLFTMNRIPKVPNSPSNFAAYTKPVVSTEVVDAHTIRLHTKGVFPLLPTYLAQFYIINHKADGWCGDRGFQQRQGSHRHRAVPLRVVQAGRPRGTGPQR